MSVMDKVFVTRSARTTSVQYTLLVNTMIAKPAIASGRFASPHGKKYLAVFWAELADALNNAGPQKTIMQWQKVWTTLKSNTRVKVAKRRRERLQTGKTTTRTILTELEKKVFGLMCRTPVEELDVQQAIPNDEIPLVPLLTVEVADPDCNIKMEELIIEANPSSEGFGEHSDPADSPSPPPQNMPRIPQATTQRPTGRYRFGPVQNASRTSSVFQKSMDQQQDVALKLAEAQKSTTKMINEMGKFFMEERMRDREERMKEREERMKESEERMREREERMREREERMREREERIRESEEKMREMGRDREERMKERERDREEREKEREDMKRERERDREERGQQHAQHMLLLRRRKM